MSANTVEMLEGMSKVLKDRLVSADVIHHKLETMMEMQGTLEKSYGYDFEAMSPQEKAATIKEFSIHLNQEVNEALYELPYFKPWVKYDNMTEVELEASYTRFKKEMVDAWHFFMNILLCSGVSATDLYNAYVNKNQENYDRQKGGYTHDKHFR